MTERPPGEAVIANTKITPTKRAKFLELVANGETLGKAANAAGTRRSYVKQLIADDPEFAAAYDEARGYENDNIRAEIRQRAFDRQDAASAKLLEVYARSRVPEFKTRVEHDHAGTVEVTNPDVTAAIERFTSTVVQLATRSQAELPAGDTA